MSRSLFAYDLLARSATLALVAAASLVAACGGSTGTPDMSGSTQDMAVASAPDMTMDPLVGSWKATTNINGVATEFRLTFNADKSFASTVINTIADTACVDTIALTGTWSTSGNMLTITPKAGTTMTASCTDPNNNMAQAPAMGQDLAVLTSAYTVAANTLTITIAGSTLTAMRQ
jgi:hypothetical protein